MRWSLIGGTLAAYAVALVVTAPASLLDAGFNGASNGRLRLAAARGTLWSGEGRLEARDPAQWDVVSQPFAWRMQPVALLRARLGFEIELLRTANRFPLVVSWSAIELTNAHIDLPASVLGLVQPKLAPLKLTGELFFRVARLSIARGGIHGSATVLWRDAGSQLSPVSPLGEYRLRIGVYETSARASLNTARGPLTLEGAGSWRIGEPPTFRGTAVILPEHEPQLAPLLRLVAIEKSKSRFALQLE